MQVFAGAVTIATNMAGRGTDIKLDEVRGGRRIKDYLVRKGMSQDVLTIRLREDRSMSGRSGESDFIFTGREMIILKSVRFRVTILWELLMRWVLQTGNSWSRKMLSNHDRDSTEKTGETNNFEVSVKICLSMIRL